MKHLLDLELSDREIHFIGHIVAHWGALEHEVFTQTLLTFEGVESLPKEMNNIQFSQILELWKERVVNRASARAKRVLVKQYKLIHHCHEYRNALVHGMWEWDRSSLEKIKTTRIKKKQVITTHFTASDLEHLWRTAAEINFAIRYPRGLSDVAKERMAQKGGFFSRAAICLFTGHPLAAELHPSAALIKKKRRRS